MARGLESGSAQRRRAGDDGRKEEKKKEEKKKGGRAEEETSRITTQRTFTDFSVQINSKYSNLSYHEQRVCWACVLE